MYLSYLIIIIGTIMCIFSQRQLWLAMVPAEDGNGTRLMMMYRTKKARLSFMKELQRIQTELLDDFHYTIPNVSPAAQRETQVGSAADFGQEAEMASV
jgi:hypothetical protein